MADKVGTFNRLGWDDDTTTATVEFEFLPGSTLGFNETFLDTEGIRGSRSHVIDRIRRTQGRVEGRLMFAPTPAELVTLLPMGYGGTPSGTSYPLAEAISLSNWIAVRDGTSYAYAGVGVDTMTISASVGGPMTVALDVIGKTETANSGTIGSNTIDASTGGPFVLSDLAVTVAATSYEVDAITITVQNRLEVKYRNSVTPTQILATDRVVTVDLDLSQGDAAALYGSSIAGVAVVATFTNGACSVAFTMSKVAAPKQPLPFGERGVLNLPWRGVAKKTGSTDELTTVLDSTP